MKLYINNTFVALYPVGGSAIVFAENAERAADILTKKLANEGMPQEHPITSGDMTPVMVTIIKNDEQVIIIDNGDY